MTVVSNSLVVARSVDDLNDQTCVLIDPHQTALRGQGVLFDLPLQTTVVPNLSFGSPTATFVNATPRTVLDFEGLIKPVLSGEVRFKGARRVENLLIPVSSGDFSGWIGVTTPSGTTSGNTITFTGAGNDWRFSQNITVTSGEEFTVSFTTGQGTKTGTIQFRDATGNTSLDETITLLATPTRYSFTVTATSSGNATIGFDNRVSSGGDGIAGSIICDNAQIENVTGQANQNPSEVVSVGVLSSPFHGAMVDGVLYAKTANANTVSSNIVTDNNPGAAFDATDSFNDADGPFGYLGESQSQNLALHNRTWQDIVWSATTMTVSDNSEVGADGRTRAATLTATAGNATLIQDLGVIASTANSWGMYIKRKTGTGDIDLTLDGGSTWTTVTTTAAFTRVQTGQTLANPDIGIRIVTSADAVIVDFGQAEASTFLSSTIPETGATPVTRNIDELSYLSAGNILDAQGTAHAEISSVWSSHTPTAMVLARGVTGRILYSENNEPSNQIRAFDGANITTSPVGTSFQNAPQSVTSTWGGNLTAYINGDPDATPAAYDGTMGTGAIGVLHTNAGTFAFDGTIRFIQIFSRELNSSQVGALPR